MVIKTLATGLADELYLDIVERLTRCPELEKYDDCGGCPNFPASDKAFNGLCERTRLRATTKEIYDKYIKTFTETGCIKGGKQ